MNKVQDWQVKGVGVGNIPIGWSILALIGAMMVGVGPEIAKLEHWYLAITPAFVGENLNVIGGILIAWVSQFLSNAR